MRSLNPNKIFVSVYRDYNGDEINHQNHEKAKEMLIKSNTSFTIVKGVYKGNSELTFMLISTDVKKHINNLDIALNLGLLFNQESVLEVLNDDTAILHNIGGEMVKIGKFTEVSETESLGYDSYTYEPTSKRFFVVKR